MTAEKAKRNRPHDSAALAQFLFEIAADVDMVEGIERRIRDRISAALLEGGTWKQIGGAVGTTAQSAWERFRMNQGMTPDQQKLPELFVCFDVPD